MSKFVSFVKDQSGATAIEYGLIAAAMGLALVIAMPILATSVTGKFSSLAVHIRRRVIATETSVFQLEAFRELFFALQYQRRAVAGLRLSLIIEFAITDLTYKLAARNEVPQP